MLSGWFSPKEVRASSRPLRIAKVAVEVTRLIPFVRFLAKKLEPPDVGCYRRGIKFSARRYSQRAVEDHASSFASFPPASSSQASSGNA